MGLPKLAVGCALAIALTSCGTAPSSVPSSPPTFTELRVPSSVTTTPATAEAPPSSSAATSSTVAPSKPPVAPSSSPATARSVGNPTRLRIPSIGVDAAVQPLYVDAANVLPPPSNNVDAGWWVDGPEPGEVGSAIIDGHVDSKKGPAVFFRLRELQAGARIMVDVDDGTRQTFRVTSVQIYPKTDFPTKAVYTSTGAPALRLVTCGGAFNRTARSYVDNVIVFAEVVR